MTALRVAILGRVKGFKVERVMMGFSLRSSFLQSTTHISACTRAWVIMVKIMTEIVKK